MAEDNSDLIGDGGGNTTTDQAAGSPPDGAVDAVNASLNASLNASSDAPVTEEELELVKKLTGEYATAREFDKPARAGFAKDRRYAAGLQDPRWASDANLIGSFLDILVSFIYAQNPDLNILPSAKVGMQPDKNSSDFAETSELIVSRQWRDGNLKRTGKKTVRSTLTVGQGWFKALMLREERPQPQLEATIRDKQSSMEALDAMQKGLAAGDDPNSIDLQKGQIAEMIEGLKGRQELKNKTGLATDFIRAEDFQCSLDVSNVMDYLEADWNSNDMYIPRAAAKARFPRLTDEDIKTSCTYFQRLPGAKDMDSDTAAQMGDAMAEGAFSKSAPSGQMGGNTPVEFVKIVELWDKRDGLVKTFLDGCKKWAIMPYVPPQATSRFYPYFGLAFYEVDGMRHPQSLVFRLRKLADEYAACRSNQRLNRERSIPGTVFNRGAMSVEDAQKIEESVSMENIGILPTDSNTPIQNIIMAKPIGAYNPELYDTAPILSDMQMVSGVQEALQGASASGQPKTATEANLEQTGFNSRTGADRDALEELLNDCAKYTLETALQEVRPILAERIAGKQAFWPFGMDTDDIMTMVEVNIQSGTTGKPDKQNMQAAWATVLPLLEKLMMTIRQLQLTDPAMAQAMEELVRETLKRLDDRLDLSQFIPQTPPPQPPPPPPPPPPQAKVNVNLTGVLDPAETGAVLSSEGNLASAGATHTPPGAAPGSGPAPTGATPPAGVQQHVPATVPGTQVPMPPLQMK